MSLQIGIVILVLIGAAASNSFRRRCQNTEFECKNLRCIYKRYWCTSNRYCSDGSDNLNCHLYPNCAKDQVPCNADRKCIPLKWACDGYKDCSDLSDEDGCMNGYRIEDVISSNMYDARNWLLKQRRGNYGWDDHTHRAISALYLTNPSQFHRESMYSDQMIMQLQIQLSQELLKGSPIPMHDVALYIQSLLSTCLDPRNFQYHDLVKELKQRLEKSYAFSSFIALVLCNANSTFSYKIISKLTEVMDKPNEPEWIEQKAYAAMTLICLRNRSNLFEDNLEDTNITHLFKNINSSRITSSLKVVQRNNGSFGNLYTTALVLQALQAVDDTGDGWNRTKALQYLISEQKNNGSYEDGIIATCLLLPVLNKRSFVDLGNVNCTSADVRHLDRNITVKEELDSINLKPQKITYSIFVGLRKEPKFSITFSVPAYTTFHDAMRLAEELDPRYRFKYIKYPWGNYVYSIYGMVNLPEAGKYWQLYEVKGKSDNLVDKAPDKLITEDNGKYAYWYRPTSRFIHN